MLLSAQSGILLQEKKAAAGLYGAAAAAAAGGAEKNPRRRKNAACKSLGDGFEKYGFSSCDDCADFIRGRRRRTGGTKKSIIRQIKCLKHLSFA